jgi:acyl-CoA thioester hydrolase
MAGTVCSGQKTAHFSTIPHMHNFEFSLRIYWEDTDAGGIVFYANYLKFFERARTEWLRTLGINQQHLKESEGVQLVVSETHVRYLRPARLDDMLSITTAVKNIGRASITVEQQAFLQSTHGELLCHGEIRIGCVDATTLAPCRFPSTLASVLPSA